MPAIEMTVGHETFRGHGTVRINAFYNKTPESSSMPFALAARDPRSEIRAIGIAENIPAMEASELAGAWVRGRYNLPERAIVEVRYQRKDAVTQIGYAESRVVLHMRTNAALRIIRFEFTGADDAVASCGYFEGRFDIIWPSQFDDLGLVEQISAYDNNSDLYDKDYWGGNIVESIQEKEDQPFVIPKQQTVETASGSRIRIATPSHRRVLRIKPKKTET